MIEPSPPDPLSLKSLRLWEEGHHCPSLAVEVVSENHPYKDYGSIQDKYAQLGVPELWVIDPNAAEHSKAAGTERGRASIHRTPIQVWRRNESLFERIYAGEGPVRSMYLGGWLAFMEGQFKIFEDRDGQVPWLTQPESERRTFEAERRKLLAELAALRRH